MDKPKKELRDILPCEGIWTVEDLANYMGTGPHAVQQQLSDWEVPILGFSRLYRHKLFRLQDLKKTAP